MRAAQMYNMMRGNPSDRSDKAFSRLMQENTEYVPPRGPGRRPNAERERQAAEAEAMGQYLQNSQSKFPTTIDIKFDNQNSEAQIKEDALNKYQENAHLLGKVFCLDT